MWVTRLASWFAAVLLLMALFVSGCATSASKDYYATHPDDEAMFQMEWNLDPGR